MPKKKKSYKSKKVKRVKHRKNQSNNVLITKILPKAKQLHKTQSISMAEAIKYSSKKYRAGKL